MSLGDYPDARLGAITADDTAGDVVAGNANSLGS